MGNDSLAQIAPAETAIGPPRATARRLVNASLSDNTRRAYAGALGQLDAWLAGTTSPVGTATARVLAGYRRTTADRGRGQARAFSADDLASELTARGASTTAVMLAGNWKSSRMVAHYS